MIEKMGSIIFFHSLLCMYTIFVQYSYFFSGNGSVEVGSSSSREEVSQIVIFKILLNK